MYKSASTVIFRRCSLALVLLAAACSRGGDAGAGDRYRDSGTETQNIDNSDRSADYDTLAGTKSPDYGNPDTNMMTRKLQPQDSSAVNKSNNNQR